MINARTGEVRYLINDVRSRLGFTPTKAAFSADGSRLLLTMQVEPQLSDEIIVVLDLEKQLLIHPAFHAGNGKIEDFKLSSDGKELIVASRLPGGQRFEFMDIATGELASGANARNLAARFFRPSVTGKFFSVYQDSGKEGISIRETASGKEITFLGHEFDKGRTQVQFSMDDRLAATIHRDAIRIWAVP